MKSEGEVLARNGCSVIPARLIRVLFGARMPDEINYEIRECVPARRRQRKEIAPRRQALVKTAARLALFPADGVSRLLGLSLAPDSLSPCGSRTRRSNVTRAAAATRDSAVPAADTSIYGDIDNRADLTAPLLGTMTDPPANGDRLTSPGKIILDCDRSSAGRPIAFRRSARAASRPSEGFRWIRRNRFRIRHA